MPRRLSTVELARRIVKTTVALTADDPLRYATLDAIITELAIPRDAAAIAALALAIDRGWLRHNGGQQIRTVGVGPTWQLERERMKRRRPRKR